MLTGWLELHMGLKAVVVTQNGWPKTLARGDISELTELSFSRKVRVVLSEEICSVFSKVLERCLQKKSLQLECKFWCDYFCRSFYSVSGEYRGFDFSAFKFPRRESALFWIKLGGHSIFILFILHVLGSFSEEVLTLCPSGEVYAKKAPATRKTRVERRWFDTFTFEVACLCIPLVSTWVVEHV